MLPRLHNILLKPRSTTSPCFQLSSTLFEFQHTALVKEKGRDCERPNLRTLNLKKPLYGKEPCDQLDIHLFAYFTLLYFTYILAYLLTYVSIGKGQAAGFVLTRWTCVVLKAFKLNRQASRAASILIKLLYTSKKDPKP